MFGDGSGSKVKFLSNPCTVQLDFHFVLRLVRVFGNKQSQSELRVASELLILLGRCEWGVVVRVY